MYFGLCILHVIDELVYVLNILIYLVFEIMRKVTEMVAYKVGVLLAVDSGVWMLRVSLSDGRRFVVGIDAGLQRRGMT